jgi:hypothetical protein
MKCSRANNKHSHFLHKKGRPFDIKDVKCFYSIKSTYIRIIQKRRAEPEWAVCGYSFINELPR